MYENENEQVESDVTAASPSETQESPVESKPESQRTEAQTTEQPEPANIPFHEHPRFKELVEQKNRYADQAKALEERYSQMEAQVKQLTSKSTEQAKQDALLERLKGIDPEFGERFERLDKSQKELSELREWKQNFEAQQARTQAVSMINTLHSEHKVSDNLKQLYNAQIELEAARNPKMTVDDLPKLYKQVHDSISKTLEAIRRSERESYVSQKNADAKLPNSQPKGAPVTSGKEFEFSKDPVEARAQLVSRVLKQSKADKGI